MLPASASAATDAYLDGPFRVVSQETGDAREYKFRALCVSGPCRGVALRREGPYNTKFNSVLHRKRAGVYRGKERSGVIGFCDNGEKVKQTVKHTVVIQRAENGRATAIRGRSKYNIYGCMEERARVRWFGERR